MNDNYEELMAEMREQAPNLFASLSHVVGDVAAKLGESPEAWRGAVVMVQLMTTLVYLAQEREMDDERTLHKVTEFMFVFVAHPAAIAAAERGLNGGGR